mmetsp:Transcript_23132/g.48385  ORF Transcript_23132/g.48385 Transcript_23132/m.48385 type:complete len:102 (+) Transcript_23132:2224-2529(+)
MFLLLTVLLVPSVGVAVLEAAVAKADVVAVVAVMTFLEGSVSVDAVAKNARVHVDDDVNSLLTAAAVGNDNDDAMMEWATGGGMLYDEGAKAMYDGSTTGC